MSTFFQKTNTGRLKLPVKRLHWSQWEEAGYTIDIYGNPVAQAGDLVHFGSGVSAGTVGKIISVEPPLFPGSGGFQVSAKVEGLDGNIHHPWLVFCLKISEQAVQEVKDFYANQGRSGRIKVSW